MKAYLNDRNFLSALDRENLRYYTVKITVLNKEEFPIREITGRVQFGSTINIDGNSSVRRTCTLSVVAESKENDLTNIDNLLGITKKIKLEMGLKNTTDQYPEEEMIWFPLGIFVIFQVSVSHNMTGCVINISGKDKMCLLNGECGGGLPASITFDSYDQIMGVTDITFDPLEIKEDDPSLEPNEYTIYRRIEGTGKDKTYYYYSWTRFGGWIQEVNGDRIGTRESIPNLFYDIIRTLVINYGNEQPGKVFVDNVPLEIKQICRFVGDKQLYYNTSHHKYDLAAPANLTESSLANSSEIRVFEYNDDVGYVYVPFTYDGQLVSNIGDNVCTVLDNVKSKLGNYEYFYDVYGNFHFQEIKNYLNTSYDPTDEFRTGNVVNHSWFYNSEADRKEMEKYIQNNTSLTNESNFMVNYYAYDKNLYSFENGNGLITSYVNTPNYTNIKNDFHIWGKGQENRVVHYHLAIKQKPELNTFEKKNNPYKILFMVDDKGNYTGQLRLASPEEIDYAKTNAIKENVDEYGNEFYYLNDTKMICYRTTFPKDYIETIFGYGLLAKTDGVVREYLPQDWRAELYLQGMAKQMVGIRPDVYEQELLDLFDDIYDMAGTLHSDDPDYVVPQFKADILTKPNDLDYFFDFLDPIDSLFDCSVDSLGIKIKSYQQDKIRRLYNTDIPNLILINEGMDQRTKLELETRCQKEGQDYSQVSPSVFSSIAFNTWGYTCQEVCRDLLYQCTNYAESISLQSIPIYYLDVNRRITVADRVSGINGDYIIKTISLPLDAGATMSISAARVMDRI